LSVSKNTQALTVLQYSHPPVMSFTISWHVKDEGWWHTWVWLHFLFFYSWLLQFSSTSILHFSLLVCFHLGHPSL